MNRALENHMGIMGMGTWEWEQKIFFREWEKGNGNKNFFLGNGNQKKSFPQDTSSPPLTQIEN